MADADRFLSYDKDHCWQYDIRLKNESEDLATYGLTKEQADQIKISDIEFGCVDSKDSKCNEIRDFIERHEWLSKMSLFPTHRFTAHYKGILVGVVIMDQPNVFSKLLGANTRKMERLISRGACISWSPKGLASALIMYAIRWMVSNTRYRIFTAYSDVEAKELGTIYQACNFTYLGKGSGTSYMYCDPDRREKGWFSDRNFRSRSAYKRYAKKLGIAWQSGWQGKKSNKVADWENGTAVGKSGGETILWENIPADVQKALKDEAKKEQLRCLKRKVPAKHKYCYILGSSKKETKQLKTIFNELNPKVASLKYPKERGV